MTVTTSVCLCIVFNTVTEDKFVIPLNLLNRLLNPIYNICPSYQHRVIFFPFPGLILRLPFLNPPRKDQLFDDTDYWILPEEGFPGSVSVDLSNAQLNNTIISKL